MQAMLLAGMNCVTALHATLQAMHEKKKELDYATLLLSVCQSCISAWMIHYQVLIQVQPC